MIAIKKIIAWIFSILIALGLNPKTFPTEVKLPTLDKESVVFSNSELTFAYDKGKFSLASKGVTMFSDTVSEYKNADGKIITSLDYDNAQIDVQRLSDERGNATAITATLTSPDKPTMKQHFNFYEGESYFLTSLELVSDGGEVASNYIAPLVITEGRLQKGNPDWKCFLEVPFDNDNWATFDTKYIFENGQSHEVGAFFTPDAKDGFIIGSVTHDTWKSAVEYTSKGAAVDTLCAYSGANTALTRDQSPHGTVRGESITSAVFMLGFYENWKDGMMEYAHVNTTFTPKRASVGTSNPIGWNSWGSVQTDLNYNMAIATSDYIKNNLQDSWEDENNVVYVNLDSFWDNMNDEQLRAFVERCEANGQVPGIYSSPFVMWWDEEGMKNYIIPGTDCSYNDIRLKKADGSFYGNDIDGCYPLDVTHPVTELHFTNQLNRLMNLGFKYIKLDFLVHGSLEGDYYNDDIQTGIQAYNYAMEKVCDIVGDDVFINLSMAPIFPYNYANGRRLCCDSYYNIDETEYVLNSLTYGFWESGLYDHIDPDHIVVWGKDGKATKAEAKSRLVSGIITGGSFLAGDNFVSPAKNSKAANARYLELLTNEKLIDVLKIGKPFEGKLTTGKEYAAEIFTLENDGKTYVAVINYSLLPKTYCIDLPYNNCTVTDLFTGKTSDPKLGSLPLTLFGQDSIILEITEK